ncbi:PilZ domain-containing protein [Sphingomonas sp. Tas61C01]|uniref:PilZ domain-containing protein n=1 Tax=Sphingomonas sp. Tas61C01 TaxID=3458297 RepID=UPI00403EEF08
MTALPQRLAEPQPDTDRRSAQRHAVKLVGHAVVAASPSVAVMLTDVSESGCQIAQSDWLGDASTVILTLDGFAAFECTVTWTSTTATGLRFDERLHPAVLRQIVALGQGRKRAQRLLAGALVRRDEGDRRWRVAKDIVIERQRGRDGAEPIVARLFDLSSAGCRVSSDVRLSPGLDVMLSMHGLDPVRASVCWSDSRNAGLTFAEPIDAAAVERFATDKLIHLPRIDPTDLA